MGNTCISMADSCQVWQKPLQYCKVVSLQLIKKKTEKKGLLALNFGFFFFRFSYDYKMLHIVATVNNAAMNIGLHASFGIMLFSRKMSRRRSYGDYIFSFFKELPYCSPQWLYQFTRPPTVQECSLFSTLPPGIIICRMFVDSYSDWCEVIPHCSFDLHFSNN